MRAVTKRGITNGGLSYFWVDFINNIKLAKDVAKRLEQIIKESTQMTKEEKDELREWTARIKQAFNFTSLYLRHQHYQTLQKSCQDGYCCAQYALGAECNHQHTFSKSHGICLCLTAHLFIGKAAVVVKQKLKEVKARNRSVDESNAVRIAATASDSTQEAANSPEVPAAMEIEETFEQTEARVGPALEQPLRISAPSNQTENSSHKQSESLVSPTTIQHSHAPNITHEPTGSPVAHSEEENAGGESSVDVQGYANQRHNHSPNTTLEPTGSVAHDEERNQSDRPPVNALFLELDSMVELSKVLRHDLRHYLKHVTCSWWQKKAEEEIRRKMINNPNIKMVKPDHKNKTLAQCLFEAMSEYFGKHGISCLGTYVVWYGKNEHGVEGFFSWYIDIIMENTTAQESRDMMPCFETILEELLNPDFEQIAGNTNVVYMGSDNALTSVELSLFVSMMNKKYSEKGIQIKNWINGEAQTNKGSVDTHFHFMNIQLAKAVANNGSKLACPHTMCDCCVYGGGIRATTTILLKEKYEAQQVFDCCKEALSKADRSGITKIHDQYFHESGDVRWRPFSNNPNDEKQIPADRAKKALSNWKNRVGGEEVDAFPATGEVLRRHQSTTEPHFTPFETSSAEDDTEAPCSTTLGGRVYVSMKKMESGTSFDFHNDPLDSSGDLHENTEAQLLQVVEEIFMEDGDLCKELGVSEFPPKLEAYWGQKKRQTYLVMDDDIKQKVVDLCNEGAGYSNKHLRVTSEACMSTLERTILRTRWDQKIVCSVARFNSLFSRKYAAEKKQCEKDQNPLSGELRDAALMEKTIQILQQSAEAEKEILAHLAKSLKMTDAELNHVVDNEEERHKIIANANESKMAIFAKPSAKLLRSHVKALCLRSPADASLDKMKKGTAAAARRGEQNLIRLAFDNRAGPTKMKIPTVPASAGPAATASAPTETAPAAVAPVPAAAPAPEPADQATSQQTGNQYTLQSEDESDKEETEEEELTLENFQTAFESAIEVRGEESELWEDIVLASAKDLQDRLDEGACGGDSDSQHNDE